MAGKGPVVTVTLTADDKGATKAVKGLGDAGRKTGSDLSEHLTKKLPFVGNALGKVQGEVKGLGGGLSSALPAAALIGGAALVGFAAKSIKAFQDQAVAVQQFKDVTASTAEVASRFVAVADDYAVSAEALMAAIGKMNKAAGASPEKFKELGIEIGRTKDGVFDSQQTFLNVVDAFNATDDASKRALIGSTNFGKGWQTIVKLLDTGSGQLKKDFADVKGFQIFDDGQLEKAEKNRLAMDRFNDAIQGVMRQLGEGLIPVLTRGAEMGATWAENFITGAGMISRFFHRVAEDLRQIPGARDDSKKRAQAEIDLENKVNTVISKTTFIVRDAIDARELAFENTKKYASNQGYRDMLDDQRKAAEKATAAVDKYRDSTRELANSQLGLEGSLNNATDKLAALRDLNKDGTATLKDYRDGTLDAKNAILDYGAQAVDTAKKEAELRGVTLTGAQAVDTQVKSLQDFEKQLDPNDPLRKWLDDYILKLLSIPTDIKTNVDLTGTSILTGKGSRVGGPMAEGGIVKAMPGGTFHRLGEGGVDEAVIPLDGRHDLGGKTTIIQNFPAGIDPRRVNDANRRWAWRNGGQAAA